MMSKRSRASVRPVSGTAAGPASLGVSRRLPADSLARSRMGDSAARLARDKAAAAGLRLRREGVATTLHFTADAMNQA
jgi:hypothetical protein